MKKLALIAALLLATSPVAAQSVQQPLGTGGQTNNSSLTDTGVIPFRKWWRRSAMYPQARTIVAMVQAALLGQVRHRA